MRYSLIALLVAASSATTTGLEHRQACQLDECASAVLDFVESSESLGADVCDAFLAATVPSPTPSVSVSAPTPHAPSLLTSIRIEALHFHGLSSLLFRKKRHPFDFGKLVPSFAATCNDVNFASVCNCFIGSATTVSGVSSVTAPANTAPMSGVGPTDGNRPVAFVASTGGLTPTGAVASTGVVFSTGSPTGGATSVTGTGRFNSTTSIFGTASFVIISGGTGVLYTAPTRVAYATGTGYGTGTGYATGTSYPSAFIEDMSHLLNSREFREGEFRENPVRKNGNLDPDDYE